MSSLVRVSGGILCAVAVWTATCVMVSAAEFSDIDKNDDNRLQAEELFAAFGVRSQSFIDRWDANDDGLLSRREIRQSNEKSDVERGRIKKVRSDRDERIARAVSDEGGRRTAQKREPSLTAEKLAAENEKTSKNEALAAEKAAKREANKAARAEHKAKRKAANKAKRAATAERKAEKAERQAANKAKRAAKAERKAEKAERQAANKAKRAAKAERKAKNAERKAANKAKRAAKAKRKAKNAERKAKRRAAKAAE